MWPSLKNKAQFYWGRRPCGTDNQQPTVPAIMPARPPFPGLCDLWVVEGKGEGKDEGES